MSVAPNGRLGSFCERFVAPLLSGGTVHVGTPVRPSDFREMAGELRRGRPDDVVLSRLQRAQHLVPDPALARKTIDALPTRDSFLPALAALGTAAQRGLSLSALVEDFSLPIALSDRLENYAAERSGSLMAHLRGSREQLGSFLAPLGSVQSVSDIDGLRTTLADGRVIHFRPSGNAPEMRCYVEAADKESAASLLKDGLSLLERWSA